ncbi:hypothetical protein Tco_0396628 [Tanacetum coccineum]
MGQNTKRGYKQQAVDQGMMRTSRPIYDEEQMAEVQMTDDDNVSATRQQHTEQPESFAKPSILGEPVLQPHRNQSVVRQPAAFKSKRPKISKPQFASQVDVNNNLSKQVTTYYFPKERESAVAKPHYMIAPSSSRYSSNDIVHNHYLEEAKKKTQEHSRNSRNFSDSKHFVCSTCQKCVFNANHDSCVTKFLKEVNSRAKVPTGKIFTSSTTKVDSEPPNGSKEDITNQCESERALHVSVDISENRASRNFDLMIIIMTSVHISSGLVLHQMMSDHNSSDLAPQRQEMSVENVSSGLVPQGQKASDYDNSGPVPPRQNVVPTAEKTDSPYQGLEFLFSPLIEEYYTPIHGQAKENNNDQAPNASFQEDEFINPFCTRVQESIGGIRVVYLLIIVVQQDQIRGKKEVNRKKSNPNFCA